jgi:hypothetical protein
MYEETLKRTRELVKKHLNLFGPNSFELFVLPGWVETVEQFLSSVQNTIDSTPAQVTITQLKDKLGELRVRFGSSQLSEEQQDLINLLIALAQSKVENSCVVCGKLGEKVNLNQWLNVRCPAHHAIDLFDDANLQLFAKHEDEMAQLLKQK